MSASATRATSRRGKSTPKNEFVTPGYLRQMIIINQRMITRHVVSLQKNPEDPKAKLNLYACLKLHHHWIKALVSLYRAGEAE